MELIGALAAGLAIFAGLMAVLPTRAQPAPGLGLRVRAMYAARMRGRPSAARAGAPRDLAAQLSRALDPGAARVRRRSGSCCRVPMAILGLVVGAFVPRWYVRYLVGSEARAASDDAPRVLRAMVNRAAAGGTYPDLFAAAAEGARHRWVKADFEEILGRYYANEPPAEALVEVRRRQAGRNLALVYDALITLTRTHQPASAAAEVLGSLGEAARSNQSIARQAAAESRGLRIQAAILAVVIPALFLYLSVANTELIGPVMSTAGRAVPHPAGRGAARGHRDRPVVARHPARGIGRWSSSVPLATALAVFGLLMAVFGGCAHDPAPTRRGPGGRDPAPAVRAAGHRRAAVWERLLAPVASRLGRAAMPAFASQVSARDIVRAGFDPGDAHAGRGVRGEARPRPRDSRYGPRAHAVLRRRAAAGPAIGLRRLCLPDRVPRLPGEARKAQMVRELPDFLALVRPLARSPGLEQADRRRVATSSMRRRTGENLLARQIRRPSPRTAPARLLCRDAPTSRPRPTSRSSTNWRPRSPVAQGPARGSPDVLTEHERSLREAERNRLLGAASTVQPKLAAILAGIYLPMFIVLVVVPLFLSTIGRI